MLLQQQGQGSRWSCLAHEYQGAGYPAAAGGACERPRLLSRQAKGHALEDLPSAGACGAGGGVAKLPARDGKVWSI